MKTILIATGNTLRGDDGAAHHALRLLEALPDTLTHSLVQLTPEMAAEIAAAETVVFLDAASQPGETLLEPLEPGDSDAPSISHALSPASLVAIARRLYNFRGRAWLCRIPGADFSLREGLTRLAQDNAVRAAAIIRRLLDPTHRA